MVSSEKLKILLLSDAASFHSQRIAEQYQKQNCDILTLSLEKGQMISEQLKRVGPIRSLHYYFSVSQIKKKINEFKPDVINAHFASGYGHIAALANKSFNLPLVTNLWGSDILIVPNKSYLHKRKTIYALKNSDCLIGDSNYLINAAGKLSNLKNSEVIPWGIEREYLDLHKKDYMLSKPLKIIVPRHQEAVYNNRFVVEALLPLINKKVISITFAGFGSLFKSFKSFCHDLAGDNIKFYEKKSRSDFLEYMASFDLYLSASLSDSSPVSLIEAMALGLIPIAGEIDGVKEWLSNENGFPFIQNNKQSLLDAISKIVNSSDTYEAIRLHNLKRVKEEAVFEENIAKQISIMQSLVKQRKNQ